MELVDDPLRGDADRADEQLRLLLDDDVDEFGELAFGVVVLRSSSMSLSSRKTREGGGSTHVGLARVAADLGEEEVDTEWRVLVMQVRLDRANLHEEKDGAKRLV